MRSVSAFLCAVLFVSVAVADQGHHDMMPEQLGKVDFPTSCSPKVQKQFERSVALLHSFWYEEALKSFTAVSQQDPACSMAYWGIAMSHYHQLWDNPDRDAIAKANAALANVAAHPARTPRERAWIAAIQAFYRDGDKLDHDARATAYAHAMAQVHASYPDDREAAIFYALSLLGSAAPGEKGIENHKQAAAILEPIFAVAPDHPGVAHYLIHSYDNPQLAQMGLPAARRYAQIAPSAPHALHMPSHIFARLGLWQDSIASNLASVAATRHSMEMHMGGADHQFHAMDYLVYAYLQSGQEAKAAKLIHDMDQQTGIGGHRADYAHVKFAALYDTELHRWSDAAALPVPKGGDLSNEAIAHWARAIGAARSGDATAAQAEVARLREIESQLSRNKGYEGQSLATGARILLLESEGWLEHAQKRDEDAVKSLRSAAELFEANLGENVEIPAREMLADLLLELNRPQDALAAYQASLKFAPNRFNGLYGAAHAAEMGGKAELASSYYAQLLKVCGNCASDRPELRQAKALVARK